MTTYPHWINEEVISQKEIDLSGYHIRSSVVYSSESMVLISVRNSETIAYDYISTNLKKNYLAGTIVSESLRLCNKFVVADSSSSSIMFSLFNVTCENPVKYPYLSESFTEARWSTMLLICDANQNNIALLKFLSETTPVFTDCYQCCFYFYKKHFHSDVTFDNRMSYEINQRNKGLDEESITWLPKRKVRITIPESFLSSIHESVSKMKIEEVLEG